jgi:hypothetical protein
MISAAGSSVEPNNQAAEEPPITARSNVSCHRRRGTIALEILLFDLWHDGKERKKDVMAFSLLIFMRNLT